jgi:hypothetical protein
MNTPTCHLATSSTPSEPVAAQRTAPVVLALRQSLRARRLRALGRPLIAGISAPERKAPDADLPEVFRSLLSAECVVVKPVQTHDDGSCSVRIDIDYADLWHERQREVLQQFEGIVEERVAFLTREQRDLLLNSPEEFLETRPEQVELVRFGSEMVGGQQHVVSVTVATRPPSLKNAEFVAILPNLVPLERMLAGLHAVVGADEDGPLAPLRALVGLSAVLTEEPGPAKAPSASRLDEFQADCIDRAWRSPHFSLIQGPPGSGKSTVITELVQAAVDDGQRVLVVSPTNVAVDNVVEKLGERDGFHAAGLPLRYAARPRKVLSVAMPWWVGPEDDQRSRSIRERLQTRLESRSDLAGTLFGQSEVGGSGPLSDALAEVQQVLCGTPIGILSYDAVKDAPSASFDVLIVDEVSKMTVPEFLAIAVKARRWVLVGDPEQLPPYNDAEDNGTTLDDVVSPDREVVYSVASVIERLKPEKRSELRLVVACLHPKRLMEATALFLRYVRVVTPPSMACVGEALDCGVLFCRPDEVEQACQQLSPMRDRDCSRTPHRLGSMRLLVERGVRVARPKLVDGVRLVNPQLRMQARLFDTVFNLFHLQPWAERTGIEVPAVRYGPRSMRQWMPVESQMLDDCALRYVVNAVSVFDWLAGNIGDCGGLPLLDRLPAATAHLAPLQAVVAPYTGTLKRQYRMHGSLSCVPRELFYFGEALHDGRASDSTHRFQLVQVTNTGPRGEANESEADAVMELVRKLGKSDTTAMVITPYKAQERHLQALVDSVDTGSCSVEVCTLDRCQGREADYVILSLVRSRATTFLDAPKRWNVALTRAREGLFVLGDIDAFRQRNARARREADGRPTRTSVLAHVLTTFDSYTGA